MLTFAVIRSRLLMHTALDLRVALRTAWPPSICAGAAIADVCKQTFRQLFDVMTSGRSGQGQHCRYCSMQCCAVLVHACYPVQAATQCARAPASQMQQQHDRLSTCATSLCIPLTSKSVFDASSALAGAAAASSPGSDLLPSESELCMRPWRNPNLTCSVMSMYTLLCRAAAIVLHKHLQCMRLM